MFDSHYRIVYQAWCIEPLLRLPGLRKVHPQWVTLFGCLIGMSVLAFLAYKQEGLALMALILSGFLDTLDGSLARKFKLTSPQGAALDIVCDRSVEFCVVLGLYLVDPTQRALLTILILGSILLCVTTFLVVGIFTPNDSQKGFFYSPGVMERTEAFIFFAGMILFPMAFFWLAWAFVSLTTFTAFFRLWQFLKLPKVH